MLFNSYEYLLFLPIVFGIYWLVLKKTMRGQNIFLLLMSYVFYGWWDWRFLGLIFLSSIIDYLVALRLGKINSVSKRKWLLTISVVMNLGMLVTLKYFNFFSENFNDLMNQFGWQPDRLTLDVILPVGISFYTFQTLSYTIDVYRKNLKASKSWIDFFAYVSFFPQLVAGPIERASHLLPQFKKERKFDELLAREGLRLVLWGIFKKVIIADLSALVVNEVFANYDQYNSIGLWTGAVFFALQIYGDFSGYTDIARGSAKLLGFDLMTNFKTPYFSRDIAEFWRRWHISLSTWFRDYLYFPLGGSKKGMVRAIINTVIIFVVSGFWHGANWTYIVWGVLNALYFIPLLIFKKNRKHVNSEDDFKYFPSFRAFVGIVFTFILTCIAWVFFRAENIGDAFEYISKMLFWQSGEFVLVGKNIILSIFLLIFIDWFVVRKKDGVKDVYKNVPHWIRYGFYILLIWWIMIAYIPTGSSFIYFQF